MDSYSANHILTYAAYACMHACMHDQNADIKLEQKKMCTAVVGCECVTVALISDH